ncbi:hypothetical protein LUZ60_008872 [Juncus effusus]|nr:hypothetical protein LUZ60_008872 [Juncus effusus]
MACLALSLQPTNGRDIMLQTREWFPPSRALAALSAFRQTRLAQSHRSSGASDDLDSSLGDDPLAASSGQVIVGVESKYRVIYRLVNSIYVLGVTTADDQSRAATNSFDCINTVNQAVSVVVSACRGVDVTPDKLYKKYPEVYMALDIVLRGAAGAVRLAAILGAIHGDNIAKLVSNAPDAESRVRGAESWNGMMEGSAVERRAAIEGWSGEGFELPTETLAAGDEVAASIAPQTEKDQTEKDQLPQQSPSDQTEKDPFAASEKLNKPEETLTLIGGFRKTDEQTSDATSALAGLEVSTLPPSESTKPTFVSVEGFEGDYGGIEFGKEEASLSEAFEGFNTAFGGGLDASEFVTTVKTKPKSDVTGLELLASGGPTPAVKPSAEIEALLSAQGSKEIMTLPEMQIHEELNAEFDGSVLKRVGLIGTVYLKTIPVEKAGSKETEFSFKLEGESVIKRAALKSGTVTSLQEGLFHVRTKSVAEPVPVLKFSVQPKQTLLPLRVRLLKRHVGKLLTVMIQYAANPNLPAPLTNVTFVVKLPIDPSLLNVSPKGVLNREERELSWHVADVAAKGIGKLRARMPVELDSSEEELKVVGSVRFSGSGLLSLSGLAIRPVSEGLKQFNEASHSYASGSYICI